MASRIIWTVCLLIFFLHKVTPGSISKKTTHGHVLHNQMTRREINNIFGVDDHSQVPEYDVTVPYTSDEETPYRQKRSTSSADPGTKLYKMDVFGEELPLHLKLNHDLMSPSLTIEVKRSDGTTTYHPRPKNSFYHGHVTTDPGSMVAVSDTGGLSGMIQRSRDTLYIQPLPSHLAKHSSTKRDGRPHIVYKRKTENSGKCSTRDHFQDKRSVEEPLPRSIGSRVKYMEAAIVTDDITAAKYGESNITTFLLSLGNIVAGLFRDESIGQTKITYVVSRIVILNSSELGLTSLGKTDLLYKMREWATRENDNPDTDPKHVDVISYVSRLVGAGGLAEVNTMCKNRRGAVSVNNDVGLQSAGIIAHEIGHNLKLSHVSWCGGSGFIMAPTLPSGGNASRWSFCSRTKIQEFLRSDQSICLDDTPTTIINSPDLDLSRFPGELTDGDKQCIHHYGEITYRQCRYLLGDCGKLHCTNDGSSCISKNIPPVDGSKCGTRHWCIKGRCEDNGLAPIDGGWSKWSDYTHCTVSCGGGVQHRTRACTNPHPKYGGKHCEGSSVGQWRTCNFMHCIASPLSFREVQCLQINSVSRPHYIKANPCTLYCRVGNRVNVYGTVKDGTRTTATGLDMCVQGKPKVVGCDHIMHSRKKTDRCGVCDGKADTCKTEMSSFTEKVAETNKSVLIKELPPGTIYALFIKRSGKTYNVIGIQDVYGTFIINVPYVFSKTIKTAGATIIYKHKAYKYKDTLEIKGPTTTTLKVVFLRVKEETQGVDWMVKRPVSAGEDLAVFSYAADLSYEWLVSEWSACPVTCAGGYQTREVNCVLTEDKSVVSDAACDEINKPKGSMACNTHACEAKWHSETTPCSKTCGRGVQIHSVLCRQKTSSEETKTVSESLCVASDKPFKKSDKYCNVVNCPAEWTVVSKWSSCSKSCAGGIMTRKVECKQMNENGLFVTVPDVTCAFRHNKPANEMACNKKIACRAAAPVPGGTVNSHVQCNVNKPCQNGGICTRNSLRSPCLCPADFTGKLCEVKINPCDSTPCKNQATCVPDANSAQEFSCKCGEWFMGDTCEEQIYPCDSSPCLNRGTCSNDDTDISKFKCQCPPWITGDNCQVLSNACESHPCLNGGYCSSDVGSDPSQYKCACSAWFNGTNCEVQIFPCDSQPCQNGATCNNDPQDLSRYHCTCPKWFTGDTCQDKQTICDVNNPCKNGRNCTSSSSSPAEYTCECGDWFTGKNCGVRVYPCDSQPCVNGATCTNDAQNISLYNCQCLAGFSGRNCQVPTFRKIACFNTGSSLLPDVLGNFINEVKLNKAQEVIFRCAELAFDKQYKFFALGYNGKCRSGPKAREEYHSHGEANQDYCQNDIGQDKRIVVFTFELLPKIIPIGCFLEKRNRALEIRFGSFPKSYNDRDPQGTVEKCAHVARDDDYEYFAVQNLADCRTSVNMTDNYDKYGEAPAENCVEGIGTTWANYVYRLRPSYTGPNACDSQPCLNQGTCEPHFNDPKRYKCVCGDWFTGDRCEVQIFPCDSSPCQNGATCSNDANDISKYHCKCKNWHTGENCEVKQTICDVNNPCKNGRNCTSSTSSPAEYTCECGDWFTGKKCGVQIYPCDSKPCVNGAKCSNDAQDISLYHCHCKGEFTGTNCQVPAFSKIACFNTAGSLLPDVLGDFKNEVILNKQQEVIKSCAELAFEKQYNFFALGYNGKCRSGPNARKEYHDKSAANEAYCPNGIGMDKRVVVYTFEPLPKIHPLGCYVEKKNRLLGIKFASFVNSYDDANPQSTVIKCAYVARDRGYEFFAVQNRGECRTGVNMETYYANYGEAAPEKCVGGVGAAFTNFVYHLLPLVPH